jgi:hypothetical protein
MNKITLKDLRAIQVFRVFGNGGTHLLRWVAVKLPNHYWIVYIGSNLLSDEKIISKGNILPEIVVKKIINCTDEVLERYIDEPKIQSRG